MSTRTQHRDDEGGFARLATEEPRTSSDTRIIETNEEDPEDSGDIDCGCAQFRMPQLAKFAVRRNFLILLGCLGLIQAAAQTYLQLAGPVLARRFSLDAVTIDWILSASGIAPIILGIAIAYIGDRYHRATWIGGLALVQCAALLTIGLSYYDGGDTRNSKDNNPYLCLANTTITFKDQPLGKYSIEAAVIMSVVQVIVGIAAVGFYALGISYIDDNTRNPSVTTYVGLVIAAKVIGVLFGLVFTWMIMRADTSKATTKNILEDQTRFWWIGGPAFALLLALPSIFVAWFPRKLPSFGIEQNYSNLHTSSSERARKVGSADFIPSMTRIFKNKILVCNAIASAILIAAIMNFSDRENAFMAARFHIPVPTGALLGFNDPMTSRLIFTILKPITMGLVIIITGLFFSKSKPRALMVVSYSIAVIIFSAIVLFAMGFLDCKTLEVTKLEFCNRKCQCSLDADFQPICTARNPYELFFSACYGSCKKVMGDGSYDDCECFRDIKRYDKIIDGPCRTDCQISWLLFQFGSFVVYLVLTSTVIGDVLLILRSVYIQDKAIALGFTLTLIAFFTYLPGKITYDVIGKYACIEDHWTGGICRLHEFKYGYYLTFLTSGLLLLSAGFKVLVWFFVGDFDLYEGYAEDSYPARELSDLRAAPRTETERLTSAVRPDDPQIVPIDENPPEGSDNGHSSLDTRQQLPEERNTPPRTTEQKTHKKVSYQNLPITRSDDSSSEDESPPVTRGSSSQVSYKPLEGDSDAESEHVNQPPVVPKKPIVEPKMSFPDPANYPDPRLARRSQTTSPINTLQTDYRPVYDIGPKDSSDGGSTSSSKLGFKPVRKRPEPINALEGDFNELGIPVIENYESKVSTLRSPTIMMAIQQLSRNPSRELLEQGKLSDYTYEAIRKSYEHLEHVESQMRVLAGPESLSPRPGSRGQSSSGFGSLQDLRDGRVKRNNQNYENVNSEDSDDSSQKSDSAPPSPTSRTVGSPMCTNL